MAIKINKNILGDIQQLVYRQVIIFTVI